MVFEFETISANNLLYYNTLEVQFYNILGQLVGSFSKNFDLSSGINQLNVPIRNYINSSGVYILEGKIIAENSEEKYFSKKVTVIK